MPSITAISALASLALSSVSFARPIPNSISLFRRAILDAKDGILVIQNKDTPKKYGSNLEPYDQYHFRYMAIGCGDVEENVAFFEQCCHPRGAKKQSDKDHPVACRLDSYLVYDPVYYKEQTVAKLGSIVDYQDKMKYDDKQAGKDVKQAAKDNKKATKEAEKALKAEEQAAKQAAEAEKSSSSSEAAAAEPTSSETSSSAEWTAPAESSSSSSSDSWTPEPEAAPTSTESSSSSEWVEPSSSSSEWVEPSSSSSSSEWVEPSSSSSSEWVEPSSSSSEWVEPSSSSEEWQAPTANARIAKAASNDFSGTASWFTQNGNAGACGIYHADSDYIVALKTDLYGWTGQASQYCGRSLTITNTETGATANAVVADACPGCASYYSLDLSTGLFQALGSLDQGLLPITWHWN